MQSVKGSSRQRYTPEQKVNEGVEAILRSAQLQGAGQLRVAPMLPQQRLGWLRPVQA